MARAYSMPLPEQPYKAYTQTFMSFVTVISKDQALRLATQYALRVHVLSSKDSDVLILLGGTIPEWLFALQLGNTRSSQDRKLFNIIYNLFEKSEYKGFLNPNKKKLGDGTFHVE